MPWLCLCLARNEGDTTAYPAVPCSRRKQGTAGIAQLILEKLEVYSSLPRAKRPLRASLFAFFMSSSRCLLHLASFMCCEWHSWNHEVKVKNITLFQADKITVSCRLASVLFTESPKLTGAMTVSMLTVVRHGQRTCQASRD